MAGGVAEFVVTNPRAIREACVPLTRRAANELSSLAASLTPSDEGELRRGWHVVPGRVLGAFVVVNNVEHGRHIENGTRHIRPVGMLARAAAQIRGRYGAR